MLRRLAHDRKRYGERALIAPWAGVVTPKNRPYDRVAVFVVPEDAPPWIREGFARRRVVVTEGQRPRGASAVWSDELPDAGTIGRVLIRHLDDCPAGDAVMIPALLAWHDSKNRSR